MTEILATVPEATPEMVAAGLRALYPYDDYSAYSDRLFEEELLPKIWKAMLSASPAPQLRAERNYFFNSSDALAKSHVITHAVIEKGARNVPWDYARTGLALPSPDVVGLAAKYLAMRPAEFWDQVDHGGNGGMIEQQRVNAVLDDIKTLARALVPQAPAETPQTR